MGGKKSYQNYGKTFRKPKRPFEKERLDSEMKIVGEYGLKNKREVWRVQYALAKIRTAARHLLTLDEKSEQRMFQGEALLRRMIRIGLLMESEKKLDYVLGLTSAKIMERRLQTKVFKLGLAKSIHHARVLIRQPGRVRRKMMQKKGGDKDGRSAPLPRLSCVSLVYVSYGELCIDLRGARQYQPVEVHERDWLGISIAFLLGIALLRCWDRAGGTVSRERIRGDALQFSSVMERSLGIKGLQVLVHFPDDANGFYWHMRILLVRAGAAGVWVTLTPTLDLFTHDLSRIRHIVLARNAPWPARVNRNDIFGFDPITRVEFNQFVQLAKVQARVLADDDMEAEAPDLVWLRAGLGLKRLGEVVPQEVVDGQERFTEIGDSAVAEVNGAVIWAARVNAGDRESWIKERQAVERDDRTIGVHLRNGKRYIMLKEALALYSQVSYDDWGFPGPRLAMEYLGLVDQAGGFEVDQVDAPYLQGVENLCRRQVQLEMAVERNPSHPDFGLEECMGGAVTASGAASVVSFRDWVAGRQKDEEAPLLRRELPAMQFIGDFWAIGDIVCFFLCLESPCIGDITSAGLRAAAQILRHYDTQIERSTDELFSLAPEMLEPHRGPTLRRSPAKRRHLFKHLAGIGLACFSYRRPPTVQLGSARAMVNLDLSDDFLSQCGGYGGTASVPVLAGDADVDDGSYNFSNVQLASWFCMGAGYTADDAHEVGIQQLFICFEGLCMGWSWSLYLCQKLFENLVAAQRPLGLEGVPRDRTPAPELAPGVLRRGGLR
ncbi:unnamed protein product [Prorocentrum cordatum]|uniref:Small ribosomal subunit protein uS4 N-terminal domain-containing protein n=1 Tax=Prorocentrum cordatum TaxID=2364126 RepID=A0ABN9Y6P8_9DINO|nr:unnamed protein product [Polarella glacialis]